MRRARTIAVAVTSSVLVALMASCEEHFPAPLTRPGQAPPVAEPSDGGLDGADAIDGAVFDGGLEQDAGGPCNARVASPPIAPGDHVPEGSQILYGSNPPSSGPHYPVWANFQEIGAPVDDGYLVHSMEHGAVVLFYKCDDDAGACADMVAQLRAVRDAVPSDPRCDPSIRVRIIIAPRPANDVPVAAAAWGQTYRADCVDPVSLGAFITAHYAKAPEDLCVPGKTF